MFLKHPLGLSDLREGRGGNLRHKINSISKNRLCLNTLRPEENGWQFTDYILKCIFLNKNYRILTAVLENFVHWQRSQHQFKYSGVPNRRAGLLIYFSFYADLTYAYLALPVYFFWGYLAACTKFKSDRPTETIKCVNVDYFTSHSWALYHLISVYMAVIIHILHDENQSLLKTVVSARRLNQN